MSANLREQFPKLEMIAAAKKQKTRRALLEAFADDDNFFKAVRELVKNTVKKNIKITEKQRKKLIRYKSLLFSIFNKKTSKKRRRKLMIQTGTGVFIPLILPLAAAVISSLTSHLK